VDQDSKINLLASALKCNFRDFQSQIKNAIVSLKNASNDMTKNNEHLQRRIRNL